MKRSIILLVIVMLLSGGSGILTGCNSNAANSGSENEKQSITDMAGKTYEIPAVISKYAVLWVGATDIAAMLDQCEHMVAYPETSASYSWLFDVYPSMKSMTVLSTEDVMAETIIETGAQIVFMRTSDNENLVKQLNEVGIVPFDIEFSDYESLKKAVTLMAEILDSESAINIAQEYCKYTDLTIESVTSIASKIANEDKVTAIVIRDVSSFRAYGAARFSSMWVTVCGARNSLVDGDPNGYVNLTSEQLISYDPDFIFFALPDQANQMYENQVWSALKAVKNKNVLNNPCGFNTWSNQGAEGILQLKWAISILYPEYADYEIKDEVREFYKQFYEYTPSEKEINDILNV